MAKIKVSNDWHGNRRAMLEKSLTLSLGLFLLIFLSWQSVEIKAYQKAELEPPTEVINIPETQQPRQDVPPVRPSVVVETEDEDLPPEIDIPSTELDGDYDPGLPPHPPEDFDIPEFVPVEKMPELIHFAKPYYPEIAQKAGLECVVFVYILVDENGNPAKVKVAKPCGKAGFNEAAEEAAWKCKFTPGRQNEKPVRVWVSVPFRFELRGSGK